jgi:hypothetical protein
MYRGAFARHRTGAALLLGLSLRAPSASAEPVEPDETRVVTVEGKAAEELPSAAETPPILAAPIVPPRLIRDDGVAYPEQALGEPFYERVEVRLIPELDAMRLFDVGGLIETPFARGRGSLYSYGAALVSLLSPEVKLDDRDYQARATYEPSARDPQGDKRNGILTRLGDACRPRITFTW